MTTAQSTMLRVQELENKVPEFFDKRLNQTNIKQFLEDNPDLMPKGLNQDTEYSIVVRKK